MRDGTGGELVDRSYFRCGRILFALRNSQLLVHHVGISASWIVVVLLGMVSGVG